MEDKKTSFLALAKIFFEELQTDDKSVLFTEGKINNRSFKMLKKSRHLKGKEPLKLITCVKDFKTIKNNNRNIVLLKLDYDKKRYR